MEWDLDALQGKLSTITASSKECDKKFKETIQNVSLQDESKESYETLYFPNNEPYTSLNFRVISNFFSLQSKLP